MSSACTRDFLSHSTGDSKPLLTDHLLKVARKSAELFSHASFGNKDLAFYSGLLHDLGKISPLYQAMFHNDRGVDSTTQTHNKYVQEHSIFSAWASAKLLWQITNYETIDKVTLMIAGHHGSLRRHLPQRNDSRLTETQKAISNMLSELQRQSSSLPDLANLSWDVCIREFGEPIDFDQKLTPHSSPHDYLEMSYAFSCMLQADRGSFSDWITPSFDLDIHTTGLEKKASRLSLLRSEFQKQVMAWFDAEMSISVINAPTGMGKTKVFLDIVKEYARDKNVERVFYFSPLLALTEDFEKKIAKVISNDQQKDILIYNHLYSASLEEKMSEIEEGMRGRRNRWIFENESFNKKLIITTTQRLLITIYSNKATDRLKMASLKNSVLIIDEVQTIPKPILSNLVSIFKDMSHYMDTKFILVSATVPHELRDLPRFEVPEAIKDEYLWMTKKPVRRALEFDAANVKANATLIMANTRRKAVERYKETRASHPEACIKYLSSGVRKRDRVSLVKELPGMSDYILVSTQVVEAGVDISFSHVFREQAPLDNIIQVMGRLNREADMQDAQLTIYSTDGSHIPYSQLEFEETNRMLDGVSDSIQMYDMMDTYYERISQKDFASRDQARKLEKHIRDMDFERVWECVKKIASEEIGRDSVIIPDRDQWDSIRLDLLRLSTVNSGNKALGSTNKRFGTLSAYLPMPLSKMPQDLFDEDLMKMGILFPKKEHLGDIYDENLGLDKWLLGDEP